MVMQLFPLLSRRRISLRIRTRNTQVIDNLINHVGETTFLAIVDYSPLRRYPIVAAQPQMALMVEF